MHNQKEEVYDDIVGEVKNFLVERAQAALEAGVAAQNIWLDPGFGFSKNVQHNLDLLHGLQRKLPVLVTQYCLVFSQKGG